MDLNTMIDEIQREELIINVLDIQGTSEMVEVMDGDTGDLIMEENYKPTKIVAEVIYAGEKVSGLDVSIQYTNQGHRESMQIAWYLDPYIYTNSFASQITTDANGNEVETTTMDIRIFGPAGCDVQLQLEDIITTDVAGEESSTQDIAFVFNNTRIEVQTVNIDTMIQDIQTYRETTSTATSTPTTADYLVDAKIYHKGFYMAYLYPEFNSWRVGFTLPESSQDFVTELWNPRIL